MARRPRKQPPSPVCPHCQIPAVLVTGAAIYPRRPDLHEKQLWQCTACDAYVGCHGKTSRPLGVPANAELRRARMLLHDRVLDPLWQRAEVYYNRPEDARAIAIIRNSARKRVYAYLGWKLGLDPEETHTAMFDLETCRRAWTALAGIDYPFIRAWYKAREASAGKKAA